MKLQSKFGLDQQDSRKIPPCVDVCNNITQTTIMTQIITDHSKQWAIICYKDNYDVTNKDSITNHIHIIRRHHLLYHTPKKILVNIYIFKGILTVAA